jgi:hypothetical protein
VRQYDLRPLSRGALRRISAGNSESPSNAVATPRRR